MSQLDLKKERPLGDFFREKREEKNISIDDVVDGIRIRKVYIEALEQENFEVLPERTYVLGYIRAYANFLEVTDLIGLISYVDEKYDLDNAYYLENDYIENEETQVAIYNDNVTSKSKKNKLKNTEKATTEKLNIKPALVREEKNTRVMGTKPVSNRASLLSGLKIKPLHAMILFLVIGIVTLLFMLMAPSKDNEDIAKSNSIIVEEGATTVDSDTEMFVVDNPEEEFEPQEISPMGDTSSIIVSEDNLAASSESEAAEEVVEEVVEENPEPEFIFRRWPEDTKDREININFTETVWVRIFKTSEPNVVYLDRIYNDGDSLEIPGIEDISLDTGNYKGMELEVEGKELEITSTRSSLVLKNIVLDEESLLETYEEK